jgi:hypothetical protein
MGLLDGVDDALKLERKINLSIQYQRNTVSGKERAGRREGSF